MEKRELYHYGVKGMKWGVRKAQIKSAGRTISKKFKNLAADISKKRKARKAEEEIRKREQYLTKTSVKKLTTSELQERAKILTARKQALDLEKSCKQVDVDMVNAGKSLIKKLGSDMLMPAVINAGKNVLGDYFIKVGKDALGLSAKDVDDVLKVKTWDDKLKKQQYEANKKKAAKEAAEEKAAEEKAAESKAVEAKAAEDKAAKEAAKRKAAAQKLVEEYNAKWMKGDVSDSVTSSGYSMKGKDLAESKTYINNYKNDSVNNVLSSNVSSGQRYIEDLKEYPLLLLEDKSSK